MKRTNIAFFTNGSLLKIPFEGSLIYQNSSYVLSGRLIFPENATVKESLLMLTDSKSIGNDIISLIPEIKLTNTAVTISSDTFSIDFIANGLTFLYLKQGENSLLLFDMEQKQMPGKSFLKGITENLGLKKIFIFCVASGQRINPDSLPGKYEIPTIPSLFSSDSSLLYTKLNLTDKEVFPALKIIGALFGLSEVELLIGHNSQKEWMGHIQLPTFDGGFLEAKNLALSFHTGEKPSFGLNGDFLLKISDKKIKFKTYSQFGEKVMLSAEQADNDILDLSPFQFSQMALALSAGAENTEMAVCGRITLRKLNVFGAFAAGYSKRTRVVTPKMFSLAISDITLQEVVESIAGIEIEGETLLNQISIEGIKIPEQKKDGNAESIQKNISEWGNWLRGLTEDLEKEGKGTEKDFTYTLKDNRYIAVMDKAYMRHYVLIPNGNSYIPQVEAQFIVAKEEVWLGGYHVEKGAFVCANICIFGTRVMAYLNMKEDAITACMAISPIRKSGVLEITGTPEAINKAPVVSPPAIVNSIINQSKQEKGAICYFSASKKNGINLYLDAHINILKLIEINATIQMSKGMVRIDTCGTFLSLFDYALSLECSYGDFDNASFKVLLVLDTSKLKEKFRQVQQKIKDAQKAISNQKSKITEKFNSAKREVDKLKGKIDAFDRELDSLRTKKSKAGFFKKIKYAFQILGVEIAKKAVQGAMAIAKGVLKLAEEVAKAPFTIANLALDMVNAIIEGALNLFYIERLVVGAELGKQNGFLFEMNFVLFGTKHSIQYQAGKNITDGNNVLSELDSRAANKSDLQIKEVPQLESTSCSVEDLEFNLDELAESLASGKVSIDSAYRITQETQKLYTEYVDDQMDYAEREEIETALTNTNWKILEYMDLSEKMGESAQKAINVLDQIKEEPRLQTKSTTEENSQDNTQIESVLLHKEQLLKQLSCINEQHNILKETLNERERNLYHSSQILKKGNSEHAFEANIPLFWTKMQDLLITEGEKAINNDFIIPGYEPSIMKEFEKQNHLQSKNKAKVRKGYISRMEN